jgi:hypothetical protein
MECRLCGSTNFHVSRLRAPDLSELIFLHYPVRCLACYKRESVNFFTALRVRHAQRRWCAEEPRRKAQQPGSARRV